MMNNSGKAIGSAVLAAAMLAGAAATASAEQKLIYSTFLSPEHTVVTKGVKPYAERVNKDTGGSLTFEVAPGGSLASAKETLDAIRTKAVDAGYVVDIYTPAALPENASLSGLALLGSNIWAATGAMNETVLLDCADCRKRLVENNVWPIAIVSTSPFMPLCTTEIRTAADIKGKKIRATSAWAVWASAVGAVPVNIPSSEIYEALQRGQADCSMGPPSHFPNYSLYDVVKYVTDLPTGAYFGALFLDVRADVWNKLSDTEKKALVENAPQTIAEVVASYVEDDEAAKTEAQARGIKWVEPGPDLLAAHAALKPAEVKRVIDQAKGKVADSEKLVTTFTENLDKWEKIAAEVAGDPKAYAEALRREIYSKLPMK